MCAMGAERVMESVTATRSNLPSELLILTE